MQITCLTLLAVLAMLPLSLHAAVLGDWQLEASPGFLVDSSSGARDLTHASTTVNEVNLGAPLNGAADFAGGYLSTPDDDIWTDSTMTVEIFFRADNAASGSTQVLASHWDGNGNQRSWVVGLRSGRIRILQSADGAGNISHDVLNVNDGQDYYLAVVFNGPTANVYLKNFTLDADFTGTALTGMLSAPLNSTVPLTLGATATPSSPFDGQIGRVRISDEPLELTELLIEPPEDLAEPSLSGYKGIWFNLGQYSTYGPKYSGGFATYTAKHRPLAVYAESVDKTFFTYGGTTSAGARHLLLMASWYDHANHLVPRPTVVMDKNGVDDPHDNSSIQLDDEGYVYIFVSGRSNSRNGYIFKSTEPYSTDSFEQLSPPEGERFAYPQIWYLPGTEASGDEVFFHLFTQYSAGRELYFSTSPDAQNWTTPQKFAALSGSYQASNHHGNRVGTAFNRHPGGVDNRTDLYYIQTDDFGETWTTVDGAPVTLPVSTSDHPARVIDYSSQGRLVYMKDLAFDDNGYPIILYVTSSHYQPGPNGEPRTLQITHWIGDAWETTSLPPSATANSSVIHNYSTGCLFVDGETWSVIAPTGAPEAPGSDATQAELEHYWGTGGELERWVSNDHGATWTKTMTLTRESPRKHGYVRAVQNASDPFSIFWTDGNPEALSEAHLYFGNLDGSQYWELPYDMDAQTAAPEPQKSNYLRWQERHREPDDITENGALDPATDDDQDHASNADEYNFGTDPTDASDRPTFSLLIEDGATSAYAILGLILNEEAQEYIVDVKESTNLVNWSTVSPLLEVKREPLSNGLTYLEWQAPDWTAGQARVFYQLSVEAAN